MKIVFNACNLLIGGGRRIGTGIIESLFELEGEDEIHIFLPKKNFYNFSSTAQIRIHYLPYLITKYFPGFLAGWYLFFKVRNLKPDAIFSLGNYAIPIKRKQLLLLQWPYAVYPDSQVWDRMSLLNYVKRKLRLVLFKRNLRFATVLTVQTELMKSRVEKYIKISRPIEVVPSAVSHIDSLNVGVNEIHLLSRHANEKLLLFVSEYYSHKNLEVILPLAERIEQMKLPFRIVLTLEESNREANELLLKIKNASYEDKIINLGRIKQEEVATVYRSCDGLLFPTLLETYGFPYLEASLCRIPIFTSDLDFARAMNGDNAWYFDPCSVESILDCLIDGYSKSGDLEAKIENAYQKAITMPTWSSITKQYMEIIRRM